MNVHISIFKNLSLKAVRGNDQVNLSFFPPHYSSVKRIQIHISLTLLVSLGFTPYAIRYDATPCKITPYHIIRNVDSVCCTVYPK